MPGACTSQWQHQGQAPHRPPHTLYSPGQPRAQKGQDGNRWMETDETVAIVGTLCPCPCLLTGPTPETNHTEMKSLFLAKRETKDTRACALSQYRAISVSAFSNSKPLKLQDFSLPTGHIVSSIRAVKCSPKDSALRNLVGNLKRKKPENKNHLFCLALASLPAIPISIHHKELSSTQEPSEDVALEAGLPRKLMCTNPGEIFLTTHYIQSMQPF
ncbi:uncharacterized protein LOC104862569 isoform X2 [Fukomys damarensis]|uniref:uncharacterized protein LOC104862569 isoform X2 n=1 Tax=Fukomys damarensis TaxID=885580 RepID=UPI0008FECF4D|nr:uncharacterized protein LOC104862569 isoform X2 [Fukomys damarensis]